VGIGHDSFFAGDFIPDHSAVGFLEEDGTDNEGDGGNGDGEGEAGVDVAGGGTQADADYGEQAAEDSVAYVIGEGDGGVTDFGGESFDEIGGDGCVDHDGENRLNPDEEDEHGLVGVRRFGRGDQDATDGIEGERSEVDVAGDLVFGRADRDDVVSGSLLHGLVDGEEEDDGEEHSAHHDLLAADAVGECAEKGIEGHRGKEGDGDDDIGGVRVHVEDVLEIEEGEEHCCVGDDGLAGGSTEE
jgi:hypothetical protein